MVDLSIVIPAYNEEKRLPATLVSVYEYLLSRDDSFELIIVNDGSKDETVDVVEDFARHHDGVRLLTYGSNRGKGFAIRTGVLGAKGKLILINDADGSSPIGELSRLEKAIQDGADIAIGSRNKPDTDRKVQALAHRKHMGNTFNLIVQTLLLPGIYDTQCGFKLFKKAVGHDLFSVARLDGFAFDVEVLYIARTRKYKIAEVAIDWANVPGSKINIVLDAFNMFMEVLFIRALAWTGSYRKKANTEPPILPLLDSESINKPKNNP